MIYYIGDLHNMVVKIGVSMNPKRRLKQLQTSNSNKLVLLGYHFGNREDEKEIHLKFRQYQTHGEWFELNQEIIDEINRVNILNINLDWIDGKLYPLKTMEK